MTLTPGTRLGPYEIVAALGAGAMGEVYRARDPRLGRDVAIKIVLGNVVTDPTVRDRFEREARAVAALAHPNILAVFDVGNEGGIPFVVTELLQGETLRRRLAVGGPIPPRRALEVAVQVARGLAAAHDRGIVHRDLKPENLFVTDDAQVKILDFGLARLELPEGSSGQALTVAATQPGMFVGTPGYASPEQVQGEPATPRSDLFALGVVLHEMLTGRHPFERPTAYETLAAILRADPPRLDGVAGLPPGVASVIDRCLAKRAAERPGSAADLAFLVETLGGRGGDSLTAPIAPAGGGLADASLVRARRRLLSVAAGSLLLLVAAAWVCISVMAGRIAAETVDAGLARGQEIAARTSHERLTRLRLTARLVASFPELKALFETDTATIRDHLLAFLQRNPGAGVLLAFGAPGDLLARTDEATTAGEQPWFAALLQQRDAMSIIAFAGRPYHAAAAESEARGTVFGYIVAAAPVDAGFAQALSEATQDDVVLLGSQQALGTTLRGGRAPWSSLAAWRAAGGTAGRTIHTAIAGSRVAVREVPLQHDPAVSALLVRSDEDATAPYRRVQRAVVLVGLIVAALAIAGSVWLTRDLTRRV
jgi:Protein kinase domain/Double sensory domain of two-component sensor kinase